MVAVPGLQSTGSIVVWHGLSCSEACEIFPDQGSNLCLLHWQVDSLPLSHQGSPWKFHTAFLFCRWENWASERPSHFPRSHSKVTTIGFQPCPNPSILFSTAWCFYDPLLTSLHVWIFSTDSHQFPLAHPNVKEGFDRKYVFALSWKTRFPLESDFKNHHLMVPALPFYVPRECDSHPYLIAFKYNSDSNPLFPPFASCESSYGWFNTSLILEGRMYLQWLTERWDFQLHFEESSSQERGL